MHTFEIATAAHDLRNRMSIAQCETRLLRSRVASTDEAREPRLADCLDAIEHSMSRSAALMEALLELATDRIATESNPQEELLDLTVCAAEAVALHCKTGATHQFVVEATEARLVGAWNAVAITHVISNLISNAVKFSPPGSVIRLTLDQEENMAMLRVADEGIGIPVAELSHVFEPFYRACNAERTAAGLGLGLATAKMSVNQYGGSISLESEVGAGTVVTVRLPLLRGSVVSDPRLRLSTVLPDPCRDLRPTVQL